MNGEGILTREVASDITLLEKTTAPKNCDFAFAVRPAIIRALRLGEHACLRTKWNETLLYVVIAIMLVKPANVTVWDVLMWWSR